ncbi:MAG TPA: hypothetical protein VHG33_06360 [Woeseiaceae bacterium]|nr:hypothetical protein [Woeseiaceae bacterium]
MGRSRSNILKDFYEVGGKLPWWLTVLLAWGTYALLHQYAVSDPVVVEDPKDVLSTVLPNALRNLAVYGQYIVPWVMIVGMLTSVLRRATRAQLEPLPGDRMDELDDAATSSTRDAMPDALTTTARGPVR